MPVRVLIAAVLVLLVGLLLLAADRAVKVIKRGLRRREANQRLAAAAAHAEAEDRQRKVAEQASGALTSVMPTIHDVDTRTVGSPAYQHDGASPAYRHDAASPAYQHDGASSRPDRHDVASSRPDRPA